MSSKAVCGRCVSVTDLRWKEVILYAKTKPYHASVLEARANSSRSTYGSVPLE